MQNSILQVYFSAYTIIKKKSNIFLSFDISERFSHFFYLYLLENWLQRFCENSQSPWLPKIWRN